LAEGENSPEAGCYYQKLPKVNKLDKTELYTQQQEKGPFAIGRLVPCCGVVYSVLMAFCVLAKGHDIAKVAMNKKMWRNCVFWSII